MSCESTSNYCTCHVRGLLYTCHGILQEIELLRSNNGDLFGVSCSNYLV